jgi:hypothetical protein
MAVDGQRDPSSRCHHNVVVDCNRAGIQSRPIMKAENPRHRKPAEKPGVDHRAGATIAFFGRLEYEMDGAAPTGIARQ